MTKAERKLATKAERRSNKSKREQRLGLMRKLYGIKVVG